MKKESSEQQIRALRKFVRLHKPSLPAMSASSVRKSAPVPVGRRTTRSEAAKLRAEKDLHGKVSSTVKFDGKLSENSTESTDSQSEKQNSHTIKINEGQCKTDENQCKTNEDQCKTNENQCETNSHQETAEERNTKKPRKKRISRALFRHDTIDYIKPKKQEMLQKTFSFTFKKLVDKSVEIYSKTDDQLNSEEIEMDKNKETKIHEKIMDNTKKVINPIKRTQNLSSNEENQIQSLEKNAQSKQLQYLILDMPSLDSPNAQSEFTQIEFCERNQTNTSSKHNTVKNAQKNAYRKKTNLNDTLSTTTPAVPRNVCHIETNNSQNLHYPFYGILHNEYNTNAQEDQMNSQHSTEEQMKVQQTKENQLTAQQRQIQVQQTIEEQLKRQQFEKHLKAQQFDKQTKVQQSTGKKLTVQQLLEEQIKVKQSGEEQMKSQQLLRKQLTVQQLLEEQIKAKQSGEEEIKAQQLLQKQMRAQKSIGEQMKTQQLLQEQMRAQQPAGKQLIVQQSMGKQIKANQSREEQMKVKQSREEQTKAQQLYQEQMRTQQPTGKQLTTQQSIGERIKAKQSREEQMKAQQLFDEQMRAQQSTKEQLNRQQMRTQQLKSQQSIKEQIPKYKITIVNSDHAKTNETDNITIPPHIPQGFASLPNPHQYLFPPQYQKVLEKQFDHYQRFPEKRHPVRPLPSQYFHPNNPYMYPENPYNISPYLPPPYPHNLIPKQRQIWNPHINETNNKNIAGAQLETANLSPNETEKNKNDNQENYLRFSPKSLAIYQENLRQRDINLEEKLHQENDTNSKQINLNHKQIRHTNEVKINQQINPNCTIVKDQISINLNHSQQKLIRAEENMSVSIPHQVINYSTSDQNLRQQKLIVPSKYQDNNKMKLEEKLPAVQNINHNFISQIPLVQNISHRYRNNQEVHEKLNENIPQGQKRSGSPTAKTNKKRVSFDSNIADENNILHSVNYANNERVPIINKMPNTSQTRNDNINKPYETKIMCPEEEKQEICTKESVIVSPTNRQLIVEQKNEQKNSHLHNRNKNNVLFTPDKNQTPAENSNKIMQCSVIKKVCTENKNKHSIENILSSKCSKENNHSNFEINNNKNIFDYKNDKIKILNIEDITSNDAEYIKNNPENNLATRTVIKNNQNDLKIKSYEFETIQNNPTPSRILKRRKTLQHIDLTCDSDQQKHNSFTLEQQFTDRISLDDKHTLVVAKNRLTDMQSIKNTQTEQKMNPTNVQEQKSAPNIVIQMPKLINMPEEFLNKRLKIETSKQPTENRTNETTAEISDNRSTIETRVNNYACNVPFLKPAHCNNKVNKTIETTLPLNLSLKNDAQKTTDEIIQSKRQSIIVNNKKNRVSNPIDITNLSFVKNDEEYKGYLKLLKEKNAVGPYLFYEFVAKVRKNNNQQVFDLITFFSLLKQGKLLEYKIMYNQCNKNN